MFAKLVTTPTWKKYLEENLFVEAFQRSAELNKFIDEYTETMRGILREGGHQSCALAGDGARRGAEEGPQKSIVGI